MGDTIRLNFTPPKFTVRRFPVPRKLGPVFFEMPVGSQLLGIDAPDHDPTAILFLWAIPVKERPTTRFKFLVVEEGQPFEVEECSGFIEMEDGTVYEETHTHLDAVGFWSEVSDDDGSYKTIHVLEIIDDDPVVVERPAEDEEPPPDGEPA
jgi:hypothetical protein